jgi:hypothetical protein
LICIKAGAASSAFLRFIKAMDAVDV